MPAALARAFAEAATQPFAAASFEKDDVEKSDDKQDNHEPKRTQKDVELLSQRGQRHDASVVVHLALQVFQPVDVRCPLADVPREHDRYQHASCHDDGQSPIATHKHTDFKKEKKDFGSAFWVLRQTKLDEHVKDVPDDQSGEETGVHAGAICSTESACGR